MCCPGVDMATYRTRPDDSLGARLIDVIIGLILGIPAAVLLYAFTVWWVMG